MIIAVALVIAPVAVPGPSDDGTVKLILNVSFPSTMLSFITVMFIVLLLVPAIIVTVCGVESKSVSLPTCLIKDVYGRLLHVILNALNE